MILIGDDDPSVTTSLALLLKQNGYAACTASTPAEALELAQRIDARGLIAELEEEAGSREGLLRPS